MQRPLRWRFTAVLVTVLSCLLLSACSGKVKLHPVRGEVFYQGKPAEGATVVFHQDGSTDPNALKPSAVVGADGSFTLSTYAEGDGAPAGEYVVAVVWFGKNAQPDTVTGEMRNRLPPIYGDPKSSPLRATVNEGPNEIPPFKLPFKGK